MDVLGGMFWLLARCEEIVIRDRDAHGRFPMEAALAAAEGFVDRPLADEYVDLLRRRDPGALAGAARPVRAAGVPAPPDP